MASHKPDFFWKEAQRLRYVARSAFKLLEIQKKHNIIKPGGAVLDLGCAPGAWLQVACQSLGPRENGGTVIGIDIKDVSVPVDHTDARVKTFEADVFKLLPHRVASLTAEGNGFSTILSDMCPEISGIGTRDALLSAELGLRALQLALGFHPEDDGDDSISQPLLLPKGSMVIKLLEGQESQGFPKHCRKHFTSLTWLRPKATRPSSREIYLIAKQRKKLLVK